MHTTCDCTSPFSTLKFIKLYFWPKELTGAAIITVVNSSIQEAIAMLYAGLYLYRFGKRNINCQEFGNTKYRTLIIKKIPHRRGITISAGRFI